MRIQLVGKFVGKLTILLGLSMVFPLLWALYYQEAASSAFCISIGITIAAGIVFMLLCHPHPEDTLRQREGFAMVTLGWLVATIFGSLPFLLAGVVASPVDAIFETMSGFTTTGASIFPDVEVLPKSILMWRSLTQWLGGLGIVVLFVALLAIGPGGSAGGGMLIRAEYSGGSLADRISPRMSDTAKALWLTYFGLSVAMLILLRLGGMSFFDAFVHTFATVSTGGFSSKNASMGFYDGNGFLQWVVIIFMFLSGANIALYYFLLVQRKGALWKSGEFRCYLAVTLICTGLVCLDLMAHGTFSEEGFAYSFRQALFQVVSVMTTTGFASADYNMWPVFSVFLLFLLFFLAAARALLLVLSRLVAGCCFLKTALLNCNRCSTRKQSAGCGLTADLYPPKWWIILPSFLLFICCSFSLALWH